MKHSIMHQKAFTRTKQHAKAGDTNGVIETLSIQGLANFINQIPANAPKNAYSAVKGIFKTGDSAGLVTQTPFLFADLDVKPHENVYLYNNPEARESLYHQLGAKAILWQHSNSKTGAWFLFYVPAILDANLQNYDVETAKHAHLKFYGEYVYAGLELQFSDYNFRFDRSQGQLHQRRSFTSERVTINYDYHTFNVPKYEPQPEPEPVHVISNYTNNGSLLASLVVRIEQAPKGQKHNERRAASFTAGGFIATGKLAEHETSQALIQAARANSQTPAKAENEIKKGIKDGKAQPLHDNQPRQQKPDVRPEIVKQNDFQQKHKIRYDKVYPYESYVSELTNELHNEITEHSRLIIQAPTGGGKTTALLNTVASNLQGRVLFAVPTLAIAHQLGEAYNLIVLDGQTSEADRKIAQQDAIVISTYNQAHRYAFYFDYIFIDESHEFFSAYGYKAATIRNLMQETNNHNVVMITATPVAEFKHVNFRYIKLHKQQSQPVPVYTYQKLSDNVETILSHIDARPNKRAVIHINSKAAIQEAANELVKSGRYEKSEIAVIFSDDSVRATDTYKYLIEHNALPVRTKILLTTEAIQSGVNIHTDNLDMVYIENTPGNPAPTALPQFFGRGRGVGYRYYLYTNEYSGKPTLAPERQYKKSMKTANKIADLLNLHSDVSELEKSNGIDVSKVVSQTAEGYYKPDSMAAMYEAAKARYKALSTADYLEFLRLNYDIKPYNRLDEKPEKTHEADKGKRQEIRANIQEVYKKHREALIPVIGAIVGTLKLKKLLKNARQNFIALEAAELTEHETQALKANKSMIEKTALQFFAFLDLNIEPDKIFDLLIDKSTTEINVLINTLKIYRLYHNEKPTGTAAADKTILNTILRRINKTNKPRTLNGWINFINRTDAINHVPMFRQKAFVKAFLKMFFDVHYNAKDKTYSVSGSPYPVHSAINTMTVNQLE